MGWLLFAAVNVSIIFISVLLWIKYMDYKEKQRRKNMLTLDQKVANYMGPTKEEALDLRLAGSIHAPFG